jgi:predicted O-methyltransferase YrrM
LIIAAPVTRIVLMNPNTSTLPPPAAMLQLITGYWVSRAVFVFAKLGIADRLAAGPRTAADLAGDLRVDPRCLDRLLRMLAGSGVLASDRDGRFRLTPLGETLRSEVPDSMRGFAVMMVEDYNWDAWKSLGWSVETGQTAFEKVFGKRIFDYFDEHPADRKVFGESMDSLSRTENPAVAAAYDFSKVQRIVDVGGSMGHLLATILRANPRLRGVLYDLPGVVAAARKDVHVTAAGVAERCELVQGDFFEKVPADADAYIMKYVLHDWEDERALAILRNCRKAMSEGGRVLAVDNVVAPGDAPQWGKMLDINMMVLTGGMERTEEEFRDLFARAGLRLVRVIPTACPLSIVEGVAA